MVCRKLSDSDPEVQEIYSDDADYNEVISTKDSLLTNTQDTTTQPLPDQDEIDSAQENEGQ